MTVLNGSNRVNDAHRDQARILPLTGSRIEKPRGSPAARQIGTLAADRITSITIWTRNFKAPAKFIDSQ